MQKAIIVISIMFLSIILGATNIVALQGVISQNYFSNERMYYDSYGPIDHVGLSGVSSTIENDSISSLVPTVPKDVSRASISVVWQDSTNNLQNSNLLNIASNDGGQTFGETQNLSMSSNVRNPDIISFDQNVYVVWQDNTLGSSEILFRASNDGGQTFGETQNLSNNSGDSQIGRIAAYGQNVYVVWEDSTLGNKEIYFRASNDSGQTFGETQNLSMDKGDSDHPEIYALEQSVYVVWNVFDFQNSTVNREILFRASNDSGQTFGETQNLSNNSGESDSSSVFVYGQNVYVVWEDSTLGNDDIYFRASNDSGQTFGETQNLSMNNGFSLNPDISIFDQNVYVVWQDNTLGSSEILFRASNDGGQTFGETQNLSMNNGISRSPHIAVLGQNVYVVWEDSTLGNKEIYFRASNDSGQTFGETQNLSMNNKRSSDSQITTS